jgi:phosphopantetheine binding protein
MIPEPTVSSVEAIVAEHWCELLDVDGAQPGDSFLKLGGNSLLASMMANRLEDDLDVRPCLTDILMGTFGELVDLCLRDAGQDHDDGPVPCRF